MKMYAAHQNRIPFGVGKTEEEAREAAREWVEDGDVESLEVMEVEDEQITEWRAQGFAV